MKPSQHKPRVLLIEMPFRMVYQPSIGLSLLKAVLEEANHRCDIRYANLEFSRDIGLDLYTTIASQLPGDCLFGDLVFSPLVHESSRGLDSRLDSGTRSSPLNNGIAKRFPKRLREALPELRQAAARFNERLADELAATDYTVFGFGPLFDPLPSVAVAKALKKRDPSRRVVFGGTHFEGEMGLAQHEAHPWIDFVCRGEGEELMLQLVGHLEGAGPPLEQIPGLIWRKNGNSICNGTSTNRIGNLDAYPEPKYHDWIAQVEEFVPALKSSDLWLAVETSRGCWWGQKQHCTFCGLVGENLAYRTKSASRVRSQLHELKKYGIGKVFGVDLILPHEYFETVLPDLARDKLGLRMFFEVKANLSRRHLKLLKDAGIIYLQPGIESLSTSVLQLMRKGVTGYENVRLLKWAAEMGITLDWNLLYGFPGENPDEYRKMAEFIPLLSHLQPPFNPDGRVRVDRFSPLFFDRDRLGVRNVRPAPAYSLAYGLPEEELKKIAYYFSYSVEGDPDVEGYAAPVKEVLKGWISARPKAALFSVDRDDVLHLFDTRPASKAGHAELRRLHRRVYRGCDAGTTLSALTKKLGVLEKSIQDALDDLIRYGWVLPLDGRYLSLAVRMEDEVLEGVSTSEMAETGYIAYMNRKRHWRKPQSPASQMPDARATTGGESS